MLILYGIYSTIAKHETDKNTLISVFLQLKYIKSLTAYRLVGSTQARYAKQQMNRNTKEHIIDIARQLIQMRGYHGFSFKNISNEIGIKNSSIHHHFPTKVDLAVVIMKQATEASVITFQNLLNEQTLSSKDKVTTFYTSICDATFNQNNKMCIGGMLASDVLTLHPELNQQIKVFFSSIEDEIAQIVQQGINHKEFCKGLNANTEASIITAMIEGSLLLARLYNDQHRLLK